MKKGFNYEGEHQSVISFPLGGIGSGCIGLAGNGRLTDWEIFNRPGKGRENGLSHFSIKAEKEGEVVDARVLNGDLQPPFIGPLGREHFFEGFGWGPQRETMAGMPHFASNSFEGKFPMATLTFQDDKFPGIITMEAFNPFIPHQEDDSSLPAAFFTFTVNNTSNHSLTYHLTGVLGNPYPGKIRNRIIKKGGLTSLMADSPDYDQNNIDAGNLCLSTDGSDISYQEYLYRGEWFDALEVYWKDIMTPGPFKKRTYEPADRFVRDNGLLSSSFTVKAGESQSVRFLISWSHPVNKNTWNKDHSGSWKNYYSHLWKDSQASAAYAFQNWERLKEETSQFQKILFSSRLPASVLDSVSANLAVLKSPTLWRLEDGTLYGWEGVGEKEGSCEGSCTHVWGYAQALPFLFPALSRTMRQAEWDHNWASDGSMTFRLMLPLGSPRWNFRPAADGFFATIMKTYREWKISGNTLWLKDLWPKIKKSMEFVWSSDNRDRWDPQRSGILTGRQHHTLDMELFGPNAWLSGMYLGALKAVEEMAAHCDDGEMEKTCRVIYDKGRATLNKELFNGEYYYHKIDLTQKAILDTFLTESENTITREGGNLVDVYWSGELEQLKYQIGEGVSIDQLLGQWHADIYGLGDIFDRKQTESALNAIMEHNFIETMRDHYNPCRLYCLNDESGLVICAWPKDRERPAIPAPYSQETMHGFEYAAADLMIKRGLEKEGLRVVKAIRDRYDGRRRNPWNEMECGSNYARSMASYALLLTYSGFSFDFRLRHMAFKPIKEGDSTFLWSCGRGWGEFRIKGKTIELAVAGGEIVLESLGLPFPSGEVISGKEKIKGEWKDSCFVFNKTLSLKAGDNLRFN
jgi:non-lysosomal glucosylceramidase